MTAQLEQLTEEEFLKQHGSASDKIGLYLQTHKEGISNFAMNYGIPVLFCACLGIALAQDFRDQPRKNGSYRLVKDNVEFSARVVGNSLKLQQGETTIVLVKYENEYITPREVQRREIEKYGAIVTARP